MEIRLEHIGRRFNQDWIFRDISYLFRADRCYAVLGPNGSGKSTFLKLLSGQLSPSTGKISFSLQGKNILIEEIYRYFSVTAPYLELIEEFTLEEQVSFHNVHKPFIADIDVNTLIERLSLDYARHKAIKYFSSGMKQRVKLGLACYSDTPFLLLDEPTANLDQQGTQWYENIIEETKANRIVVVCSNDEREYHFCQEKLNILDYKS